ncbi:hypothetical protein [Nocardioides alcanivorans]|uniref:hypothetical protein n=1 Tax=Nocardioides alcanivorans TaxID=2897352 RepID=UPI001F395D42|nr:hypothetical protein [Nocardioides alcanivorans]
MNIHRHPQTRNQKIRRLAIALAALGLIAGATACSSDSSSSGASSADRLPSLSSQLDERGELPADEPSARPTEAAPDQDEGRPGRPMTPPPRNATSRRPTRGDVRRPANVR